MGMSSYDRWILRGPAEYPDLCDRCECDITDEEQYEINLQVSRVIGYEIVCRDCFEALVETGDVMKEMER